jgi:uncharacterized membrane protein
MENEALKRYDSIDFLKGLACVMMLVGHAMRISMHPPGYLERLFLYLMDFAGPIFFFMSGMNVLTFAERAKMRPNFHATRFYLLSAAALFVFGVSYNLNRHTLGFMDILQCVALCTAFVYIMLRLRIPGWAHALIIIFLYGIYLGVRIRLELNLIAPDFTALRDAIPQAADISNPEVMNMLLWLRATFGLLWRWGYIYFGFLPWVIYFYVGGLFFRSYKSNGGATRFWTVLFWVLFLVGPFTARRIFPRIYLDSFVDLLLRGIPSYMLTTLGGAGLLTLWALKKYKGSSRTDNRFLRQVKSRVEGLGKESLLFLVAHWWVLSTLIGVIALYNFIARSNGWWTTYLTQYPRAVISVSAVFLVVPLLAKLRDRLIKTRLGIALIFACMALSFAGYLYLYTGRILPSVAIYLSYGLSIGFVFVYPWMRGRIRQRCTSG